MKCEDIPDEPILRFLADRPDEWHNWYADNDKDVALAMPDGTPRKLVHAKMRQMIRRGVVGGCPCGCRGDFVITQKGLEELEQ